MPKVLRVTKTLTNSYSGNIEKVGHCDSWKSLVEKELDGFDEKHIQDKNRDDGANNALGCGFAYAFGSAFGFHAVVATRNTDCESENEGFPQGGQGFSQG